MSAALTAVPRLVVAPPSSPDEPAADLVARAQRGAADAQRDLFVRHAPELAALLRRILGRRCDVEDAVQQAFLVALERLPSLRDPTAFRPWLFQLAIRAARRMFWTQRLREIALPHDGEPLWRPEDLAPDLPAEDRAYLIVLGERLARLPLPLRQAWVLRHQFDCTLPETARACGCSLATIKRRLDDAAAALTGGAP